LHTLSLITDHLAMPRTTRHNECSKTSRLANKNTDM
jgi:hypothetical protein